MVEIVPARRARQASERDWNRITPSPSPPRTTTRDAEISRGPTCRTACLACLLPQGTVGKEAGLNEGGYRSIGRAAAGCCLHAGDGGSGGS